MTSKMRKEESGFPAKVKVGYGSASKTRGLHPRGFVDRIVWRESELDLLDPKVHIVRVSAHVGERKRIGIIAKAKERNFHIANPGKEEARPVIEEPAAEAPAAEEPVETPLEEEKAQPSEAETPGVDSEDQASAAEAGEESVESMEDSE